jgi:ABC-type lipoprotein export system ATPase subunit
MLEITNVSKYFHGPSGIVRALDGISVTVADGKFAAVQGPSGCGKTTLLLAAGGLLAPDDGDVAVNGRHPYRMPSEERARFRASEIGFVFQQFHLIPYLSVLDNVLAPSLALPQNDAVERAHELLRRFGLNDRAGHVPSELSTGERQRTALARALLNEPVIILADEPTGNLDGDNAQIVLETLSGFAASGGSVLMVTHSDAAAAYAHDTIRLQNGKIVE